ncbi:MAG: hypothetical protein N2037_08525 [Acidimicrobiales bacterium]|nr:hypothetical protein [Acidimicrobiales bacterium]
MTAAHRNSRAGRSGAVVGPSRRRGMSIPPSAASAKSTPGRRGADTEGVEPQWPTGGVDSGGVASKTSAGGGLSEPVAGSSGAGGVDRGLLDPDALATLDEQRDFLLASLRDLDREFAAGDIDATDYEALKDDYTARAAAVIRAIETRRAAFAARRRPRRLGRTLVAVAALVGFAVGAGFFVARTAGERAPGQTATGNLGQTSRDLLLAAQDQMGKGDLLGAIKTYDQVLKVDPGNVEAMAYRGWLLRLSSLSAREPADRELLQQQALEWLTQAVETDPGYADARVFRAIVHRDVGQLDAARADLAALDMDSIPPFMRSLVDNVRTDLEGGSQGSAGTPGSR